MLENECKAYIQHVNREDEKMQNCIKTISVYTNVDDSEIIAKS